jgi:hypothetical protein
MASAPISSGVDAPRTITPTLEELKASSFDTVNVEAALEALNQDGFVILKKVVDVAHVDHLNLFMTKEADELVKNNVKPFNQGVDCTYKFWYIGTTLSRSQPTSSKDRR